MPQEVQLVDAKITAAMMLTVAVAAQSWCLVSLGAAGLSIWRRWEAMGPCGCGY
jgi:hypothetical protein